MELVYLTYPSPELVDFVPKISNHYSVGLGKLFFCLLVTEVYVMVEAQMIELKHLPAKLSEVTCFAYGSLCRD